MPLKNTNISSFKKSTFSLLVFFTSLAFAQKQATNWFFGDHAGVSFSTGSPVARTDGNLNTDEGCATISDEDGNLMFYTDGVKVWNRNHGVMPNGTGLLGDPSSTQSAIIIPFPGDITKYYIFTVAAFNNPNGLNYGVVDMTLDGGLGDLIPSQKIIHLEGSVAEKITAVYHANQEDIWVIAHKMGNSNFLAYRVTPSGVTTTPVISSVGISMVTLNDPGGAGAIGCLKASPDGKKLASAITYGLSRGLQLFDFNNETGAVSNPITLLNQSESDLPYGVEFSPNSNILYCSTVSASSAPIYQYDLSSGTQAGIKASEFILSPGFSNYGSLQLALDGKIYVAETYVPTLGVINNPNVLGAGCSFVQHSVPLDSKISHLGLPPFIQSYFNQEIKATDFCSNSPTNFRISINADIASATWNFGDGATATDITTQHTYAAPGTYTVSVDFILNSGPEVINLQKEVTILPPPVANRPPDMNMCVATGQAATFNLLAQTNAVLGSQPPADFTVSYYASQADAEAGNAITTLTHSTVSQTVIAKITNNQTGCFSFTDFEAKRIIEPVANPAQNLTSCSTSTTAAFDLTLNTSIVLGPQDTSSYNVSYYTTQALANAGSSGTAITAPQAYVSSNATVYARISNVTLSTCYSITPFSISVLKSPALNPVATPFLHVLCPDAGSANSAVVTSLNTIASGLYNSSLATIPLLDPAVVQDADLANYTISYHATENDAEANTGILANGFTATDGQLIYVRIQHASLPDCYSVAAISFYIKLPQAVTPVPLHVCGDGNTSTGIFNLTSKNDEITNNTAWYTVTYYNTETAAEAGGTDSLLDTAYTGTNGETVYARVKDLRTGCAAIVPLLLIVESAPAAVAFAPLQECDPDNDLVVTFNLQPTLDAIIASFNGTVTATVHETAEDAGFGNGTNPITNLTDYTNLLFYTNNGVQTLYIRIQSNSTDCFSIATLQLIVNPIPVATQPLAPYAMCDNGNDDTDGIAIFDLTTYAPEVLNTMNPAQFIVSYFTSREDAVANTNAIPNPAAYTSAATAEGHPIFIKVTNNVTGCYDIVTLQLIVNPLPDVVFPVPYSLCDDNNPGDAREVFDLTSKINEITAGINGLDVTFYNNLQDAVLASNAIPEADTHAYTNTQEAVEAIFVRVTNAETGCFRIVILDIRVVPLPQLTAPTLDDLSLCDTDGNGFAAINLQALIAGLVNNGVNLDVRFYETFTNASNGVSPIQNLESYLNLNPANHTVWAVATNTLSGCVSVPLQLDFVVNPASIVPELDELVACDDRDEDGQDKVAAFDLTVQDAAIRPVVGVNDTIRYFASETAALAGQPMIVNTTTYRGHDDDVIWVRVENPITECFSVTSFKLVVNAPARITVPAVYVLCNEALPNDSRTVFNLTSRDTEILSPYSLGQDNVVAYFESEADLLANTPIINPEAYSNPVGENPKTILVRVTTAKGCVSYTSVTLLVLPLPNPNPTPEPLEVCSDLNNNGMATFDLTQANEDILQHALFTQLKYYVLESDAIAGTNPIPDFTNYFSASATIYVRAERTGSEPGGPVCAVVVPLQLIVNPLPATAIPPYTICQNDFTGFARFDLGNYRSTLLPVGAIQTDYIVRHYKLDPRVVPPGPSNPTLPYLYTNITNTQEIWVYAQNVATGCDVVLPLVLSVAPQTIANPVDDTVIRKCDDQDGDNDGIAEVNLDDAKAVIVGTQGAIEDYEITYYLTEADAQAGQNAVPAILRTGTTVYWARIINLTYPNGCPAYTTVPVTIDMLPQPVISSVNDSHTSCVDFLTNTVLRYVALSTNIATPGSTFQWLKDGIAIPGATSAGYNAFETGTYSVLVTGAGPNYCVADVVPEWDVTMSGPASLIGTGYVVSNAFSDNQAITVLAQGFGDYQYSLSPNGPWQNSNVFDNVAIGYHTIYIRDVTNNDGCATVSIEDVCTIDYPRFFTPNGDGHNDTWNIVGLANLPSSRIYIFDRYGKLLKQLSPKSDIRAGQGWDGTFNGYPLPSDDYWFTVTYPDGGTERVFKAHFALKR
ncbi:T9SS type B sorting domain-containing protein [Flavobacterium sp. RHBU_24]|uniref:T9SS type B sorting domain-containing protein n=1 Tax=Flavobacterium sp. RHBU_24 TaxID=3391185 RepID=UPI003984FFC6